MRERRIWRISGAALMLVAVLTCGAQTALEQRRSKWAEVTLRMQAAQVAGTTEPVALLYTDNVSEQLLRMKLRGYRIHLTGEHGEPPKTEWYHRVLGDSGYSPLVDVDASAAEMVMPGNYFRGEFRLNGFYLPLPPGKYSLYLEIQDPALESTGEWLTTNTEEFEVLAPKVSVSSPAAQDTPGENPKVSIRVRLAMDKDQAVIGHPPTAVMTAYNAGSEMVLEPGADAFRLHVTGPAGEPAKTIWYRELLREPGLPALEISLWVPPREILPGLQVDRGYPLEAYYDLNLAGKYSAFMEVRDPHGVWLTTNTVEFEMTANR